MICFKLGPIRVPVELRSPMLNEADEEAYYNLQTGRHIYIYIYIYILICPGHVIF